MPKSSPIDLARGDQSLSYFEFGALAALELFYETGITVAVLEVGLGGRLDAVNVLDADAALVVSIGLDHTDWLGPDRNSIGYEKAGIYRSDRPAICTIPTHPNGWSNLQSRSARSCSRLASITGSHAPAQAGAGNPRKSGSTVCRFQRWSAHIRSATPLRC